MTAAVLDANPDGFAAKILVSPGGGLRATIVPGLNMLCSSLVWRGEELLHLRAGLDAYAERGKTCGIPFLHPWANRLASDSYAAAGLKVNLRDGPRPIGRDANGLPNHGLLGGPTAWTITRSEADEEAARLGAVFDFAAPGLLANFPFPHRLSMEVAVTNDSLRVTTTLAPTTDQAVPVTFGFHPWLRLDGGPREQWMLTLPVGRRALLDGRGLPTGEFAPMIPQTAPLGTRVFDDLFTDIESPRVFAIEGGGRRVEVAFSDAYPWAQIYAPAASDFVCIEPMTAATNALASGDACLRVVEAGTVLEAAFQVRVTGSRLSPGRGRGSGEG